VAEQVYLREEIYQGEQAEHAPDVMATLCQEPYVRTRLSHTTSNPAPVQTLSREQLLEDFLPQGLHRPDGVIFMAGAGIKQGHQVDGSSIMDVAPTILYLLGMPVPRFMDGQVLLDMLSAPDKVRYSETDDYSDAQREGYSEDEEEAVREKLAGLGYLG